MKLFFGAAFVNTETAAQTYSPSTLVKKFGRLKTISRWMTERAKWRLSQLTASDLIEFLKSIESNRTGRLVSEKTLSQWLGFLTLMWDLRGRYPNSLQVDVPMLVDEVMTQVRTRRNIPWKALDEDVALTLIRDALDWLDDFGAFVAQTVDAAWKRDVAQVGLTRRRRKDRAILFYQDLENTGDFKRLKNALTYEGPTHKVMSKALSVTEGACLTLLLVLVGFRLSEAVALDEDCLISGSSETDETLDYLRGAGAKMHGETRRWVAGFPIRRVVNYLRELTEPIRSQPISKTHALVLSRSQGAPMFTPGQRPVRISATMVQKRLNAFARDGLRREKVQAAHFHPHMARKTFAKLAVRRDKRNLEPVSTHLGHAYREFTDGHYVGIDHELSRLLDEEDRRELSNGLTHLLTCNTLGGGAAPALAAARDHIRSFPGKKTLNKLVKDLIAKGVILAPCDWGYCVYAKVSSACRGDDKGPNELYRSPEVCSSCKNFVVTPRHLPWWEARAQREQEFLKQQDLPEQTRTLVAKRLDKTQRVLTNAVWLTSPGG